MTTTPYASRLDEAEAALERLSMADQLSLLTAYFGGNLARQSDAFKDALFDVSQAWDEAYPALDAAAEPSIREAGDEDQFWRESALACRMGMGE